MVTSGEGVGFGVVVRVRGGRHGTCDEGVSFFQNSEVCWLGWVVVKERFFWFEILIEWWGEI